MWNRALRRWVQYTRPRRYGTCHQPTQTTPRSCGHQTACPGDTSSGRFSSKLRTVYTSALCTSCCLQCFDAVGWAWWGAGVVICLELGADLHMVQLMPLPLTVSCFSKIQTGFTFLVPAHPVSPGKKGR